MRVMSSNYRDNCTVLRDPLLEFLCNNTLRLNAAAAVLNVSTYLRLTCYSIYSRWDRLWKETFHKLPPATIPIRECTVQKGSGHRKYQEIPVNRCLLGIYTHIASHPR